MGLTAARWLKMLPAFHQFANTDDLSLWVGFVFFFLSLILAALGLPCFIRAILIPFVFHIKFSFVNLPRPKHPTRIFD